MWRSSAALRMDVELVVVGGVRVRGGDPVTIDRLELEQGVDPQKVHEVDPQRGKHLFELDLERRESDDRDLPTAEHHADVQVRAAPVDLRPFQREEPVVGPGAEQVDGEEPEVAADLVEALMEVDDGAILAEDPEALDPRALEGVGVAAPASGRRWWYRRFPHHRGRAVRNWRACYLHRS